MLYYCVKPEYDNARLLNRTTRAFDRVLIGNELYTEKEWERLVLALSRVGNRVRTGANQQAQHLFLFRRKVRGLKRN